MASNVAGRVVAPSIQPRLVPQALRADHVPHGERYEPIGAGLDAEPFIAHCRGVRQPCFERHDLVSTLLATTHDANHRRDMALVRLREVAAEVEHVVTVL